MAGSCEHSNKPFRSMKGGNFRVGFSRTLLHGVS